MPEEYGLTGERVGREQTTKGANRRLEGTDLGVDVEVEAPVDPLTRARELLARVGRVGGVGMGRVGGWRGWNG